MAVKPVSFAAGQGWLSQLCMAHVCVRINKLKTESCCSYTPGQFSTPKLLEGWPPASLPAPRSEQAEGFAYTAEPTSLQNLEFMVGHMTVLPMHTLATFSPSSLETRVSTSLRHPTITSADGKYAAWQQTCFFPSINGLE